MYDGVHAALVFEVMLENVVDERRRGAILGSQVTHAARGDRGKHALLAHLRLIKRC